MACCGSARWVDRMMRRRPFGNTDALLAAAREEWFSLEPEDWLEAFRHHPRIGDGEALHARFPVSGHLSASEQQGVHGASVEVLEALENGNRAYEDKFGFIFIVCATGKTAAEMLGLLRARYSNARAHEIRTAASEQAKITELRLIAP